jgi:PTS system beta-glucosides-specific IIC component
MNKGKDRQLALSTGFTALMGITEPVIYGVNLPKKYPLIGGMIGSAAGGLYAGLNHVARYGVGHSGIPAIPLYLGEDIRNLYNILIAIVITMIVSAAATFILSTRFEKKGTKVEENELVVEEKEVVLEDTFVGSPLNGEILPLSAVKDEAFSSEALGKGFAIQPSNGRVVAPFDGEVVTIFPSKHAIGLVSNAGVEVLIHVGLDTVQLNGEHFEAYVQTGDKVKKGQLLVDFELDKLEEKGFVTQVPVVVTNTHQYASVEVIKQGKVTENVDVLKVQV